MKYNQDHGEERNDGDDHGQGKGHEKMLATTGDLPDDDDVHDDEHDNDVVSDCGRVLEYLLRAKLDMKRRHHRHHDLLRY